jgi:homoserine dehydrogenase
MRQYRICFAGWGHVARALARLLQAKRADLRAHYGIEWTLCGVSTRRLGWLADPGGLDLEQLLADSPATAGSLTSGAARGAGNVREWLAAAQADVLFELTPVNTETGQPAIEHLRAALECGAHAITANKGAVVHGYADLAELARQKGRRFLFEATVLGGTPVFSLFREALPAIRVHAFRGLLNSTTSMILSEIEQGRSYAEGLTRAQEMGVTEADPTNDVDGFDAALKAAALATVLMNTPLKPKDIERVGIRDIDTGAVRAAHAAGRRVRLVARVDRSLLGRVVASVGPEELAEDDPLNSGSPTSNVLYFDLESLHGLTIASHRQGPDTTAYGLFADFLAAARG